MKLSAFALSKLTRETRVALIVAFLIALGTICLNAGWRAAGLTSIVAAIALAAAYYLLVVRPSRIPRDAVLTLRLAGTIREDAPRSPIEQLRSHGAPTLFDIRNALQAAAGDNQLQAVLVEISSPGFGL